MPPPSEQQPLPIPQADPARVRQQLLAEGVELEEAGGSVQVVEVAAAKKIGLQELEDALLLQVGCHASHVLRIATALMHVAATTLRQLVEARRVLLQHQHDSKRIAAWHAPSRLAHAHTMPRLESCRSQARPRVTQRQ